MKREIIIILKEREIVFWGFAGVNYGGGVSGVNDNFIFLDNCEFFGCIRE